MRRIPRNYAPFAYGIIQAAITTGVATAIATSQVTGLTSGFLPSWFWSWAFAWLTMLPIVIGISPLIRRAVASITLSE
jgi:hypothetical protein